MEKLMHSGYQKRMVHNPRTVKNGLGEYISEKGRPECEDCHLEIFILHLLNTSFSNT
jgi:hypothetical protein